jgi:KDO2-lipid IV(A) lauroyltransferase
MAYRAGAGAARAVPEPVAQLAARAGGRVAARLMAGRAEVVERNLRRIGGPGLSEAEVRRQRRSVFGSYARYWVESFRLPGRPDAVIDEGHDVTGYEHVAAGLARGRGVILALPHLGGWEWSAFWLARIMGVRVTAVVEPLRPPALFEWFTGFRRSLGMHIVPLGPDAGRAVLRALARNDVVCLLADRDLAGSGVAVPFFGERTRLPGGPATLALRTGAPLCPTAVYFKGEWGYGHRGVVLPPLPAERRGRLRDDVERLTGLLAADFERLIRAAPTQWHLLQPNWPSDPGYPGAAPAAPAVPAAPAADDDGREHAAPPVPRRSAEPR